LEKKQRNRAQLIQKAALNASTRWQKIDMNHEIRNCNGQKDGKNCLPRIILSFLGKNQ